MANVCEYVLAVVKYGLLNLKEMANLLLLDWFIIYARMPVNYDQIFYLRGVPYNLYNVMELYIVPGSIVVYHLSLLTSLKYVFQIIFLIGSINVFIMQKCLDL